MGSSASDPNQEIIVARRRSNVDTTEAAVENELNTDSTETVEPIETVEDISEVDVPAEDDETEDVSGADDTEAAEKPAKEPAKPKRGELPEGLVTPVQLAHELSKPLDGNADNLDESNWRYTHSKTGSHVVLPQMVYSYLKNAGAGKNPLNIQNGVEDSNGSKRDNIVVLTEALAWWDDKNKRATERAANAQAKAEKKTAKAGDTETASETDATPVGEVEEAE
jgi:hypothetical protein